MDVFLKLDPRSIDAQVTEADKSGAYRLPRHHVYIFPLPNGHEVFCNMTRITYPDGSVPVGISSKDMTFAEMEGRIQARSYAKFLKDKVAGFQHSYLVDTGAQVGIRQSRSLVGKARLMNDDVLSARKVKGAVTFSAWPIEAHGAAELKIVYLEEDTYDIPFESADSAATEKICWSPGAACPPSTRRWRRRESPRSVLAWVTARERRALSMLKERFRRSNSQA